MLHEFELVNRKNGRVVPVTGIGPTREDAEDHLRKHSLAGVDLENVWEMREPTCNLCFLPLGENEKDVHAICATVESHKDDIREYAMKEAA